MLELVKSAATIVALIGGVVSVIVAVLGIYREWAWARREKAEQLLTSLVDDFGDEINKIEDKFDWNMISDKRNYDEVLKELDPAQAKDLERKVRRVLRRLESMAIRIKHKLLDDDMCEDYLASIGPEVLEKCSPFIQQERTSRGEARIFIEFENTVARWQRT